MHNTTENHGNPHCYQQPITSTEMNTQSYIIITNKAKQLLALHCCTTLALNRILTYLGLPSNGRNIANFLGAQSIDHWALPDIGITNESNTTWLHMSEHERKSKKSSEGKWWEDKQREVGGGEEGKEEERERGEGGGNNGYLICFLSLWSCGLEKPDKGRYSTIVFQLQWNSDYGR